LRSKNDHRYLFKHQVTVNCAANDESVVLAKHWIFSVCLHYLIRSFLLLSPLRAALNTHRHRKES